MHSRNCRCPEACEVQKPKVKVSCHKAPVSEAQPERSSLGSCFLKAACGHGDDASHVTHRSKDAILHFSQNLPFTVNPSLLSSSLRESPRVGFYPVPFHPPRIA
jgi:hypothetical protein